MPSLTPLHEPYCTIQQAPPTQGDLLEGFAQLATSSIYGVTEIVQAIHREVVLRPLGLHTAKHQALLQKGFTGQLYGLAKKAIFRSGRGVALSLRTVNKMTPENKRRPLTPALHWLVGALNGVAGDHLIRMRNPMALPMMLYDRYGQPQRGELRGRVVILVHGLCMNHLSWDPGQSVGLGEQILYRQPFSNVLYLNYNTGRRISQNGRSLSRLLEQLIQRNPQITEIDLIGHSMGGLVSRSSLFYGKQSGSEWPFLVDHLICLGSPHHGAVLERLGFMLQERLGRLPFTAGALARLLDIRSAGVIDLRHGSVRDDDWEHLDGRRGQADDIRKPAPLPARIKAYLVAGTLERAPNSSKTMEVVGDYLVSVKSALGEHENALYRLNVPEHRKAVFYGVNHFQLQYHAAVRDQVIAWLIPNAYLPHSTNKRVEYVES